MAKVEIQQAATTSNLPAVFGGLAFGLAAIPSVFLLMFKGRTGTFSTLVNRLTSLIAGTVSTLLLVFVGGKPPKLLDWVAGVRVGVGRGWLPREGGEKTCSCAPGCSVGKELLSRARGMSADWLCNSTGQPTP